MKNIEPTLDARSFPSDFVWGVSTSAFQIEGASTADGKGPSIWDRFCQVPGAIADASHGNTACNHYHVWQDDLNLISSLGIPAYRFSVSWPRVQPQGRGAWNEAGLAFYDRLIDGLLARGIQPHLTLNHWDLPDALEQSGGWPHRDTALRFVDYARKIGCLFGDRLSSLCTHNEPWVIAHLGYEMGVFAPGLKCRTSAMQSAHHLLLSHGMALQALRADGIGCKLGIVLNLSPVYPASQDAQDVAAAKLEDGKLLRWYMDPLFGKGYPEDVWAHLGADAPRIELSDMTTIAQPLDFLGLNNYTRLMASANKPWDVHRSGLPLTAMDWEIYPQGLTDLLVRIDRDYDLPDLLITENGAAFSDTLTDGSVHDADRTRYIAQHIAAVAQAMRQGVQVGGYMVWSLLDNFEWASGYEKRFGIVHVDYATQKRSLKDSALWYQRLIAAWTQEHSQRNSSSGQVKPALVEMEA